MPRDRANEARQRFREGREQAAEAIRSARSSGVVVGFKPLVSSDACKVCMMVRGRFFPIRGCTAAMLPPYGDCEFETGCESTFTEVLDVDVRTAPGRSSRRRGCLSTLLFIAVFWALGMVLWGMARAWFAGR